MILRQRIRGTYNSFLNRLNDILIRSNEMMALLYRLFKNVESYNFRSMAEYVFDNAYPISPEEQDDA